MEYCISSALPAFKAQSSAKRKSLSLSTWTFVLASSLLKLTSLPSVRYRMSMPALASRKAYVSIAENTMLNSVGAKKRSLVSLRLWQGREGKVLCRQELVLPFHREAVGPLGLICLGNRTCSWSSRDRRDWQCRMFWWDRQMLCICRHFVPGTFLAADVQQISYRWYLALSWIHTGSLEVGPAQDDRWAD